MARSEFGDESCCQNDSRCRISLSRPQWKRKARIRYGKPSTSHLLAHKQHEEVPRTHSNLRETQRPWSHPKYCLYIFIDDSDDANANLLLPEKIPGLVQLALITETSDLYRSGTNVLSSLHHGVRAIKQSKLIALSMDPKTDEQMIEVFTHSTAGRIDLRRRKTYDIHSSVFGWDNIFVVEANEMSYQQSKEVGIKHFARDMVISAFLKQLVYYKELLNVRCDPPAKAQRAVGFLGWCDRLCFDQHNLQRPESDRLPFSQFDYPCTEYWCLFSASEELSTD